MAFVFTNTLSLNMIVDMVSLSLILTESSRGGGEGWGGGWGEGVCVGRISWRIPLPPPRGSVSGESTGLLRLPQHLCLESQDTFLSNFFVPELIYVCMYLPSKIFCSSKNLLTSQNF